MAAVFCCLLLICFVCWRDDDEKKKKAADARRKADPKSQHAVADAVFDKVAGAKAESLSTASLSKYLVSRGDITLDKVQAIFDQMECAALACH